MEEKKINDNKGKSWNNLFSLEEQKELGITEFIELLIKRELTIKEDGSKNLKYLNDFIEKEYDNYKVVHNPGNDLYVHPRKKLEPATKDVYTLYLNKNMIRRLKQRAYAMDITLSFIVDKILKEYMGDSLY
jgi:hypothetical protein